MKEHGLYKYVYNEQIIYIGKSNSNIKNRINGHKRESKFRPYLDKAEIYVCKLPNSTETDLMEKALINRYKPILNVEFNRLGFSSLISVQEPKWEKYCDWLNSKQIEAEKKAKEYKKIADNAIKILKTSNRVQRFLCKKIEDGDYLCTSGNYLTKKNQEPLYRFDITEIRKDDAKEFFGHVDFPFYRRESAIAGRTYIYVRNLRDIKNIYDATA